MTKLNDLMKKAPEHTLREFARKCALRHVEKIKPYCSEKDYELIITWLETGDESIRQAVYSAAISTADSTADSTTDSAAYSAAYSAYWTTNLAHWSAYDLTYWAADWADSAADSACEAEREWQEQTFRAMLENQQ